jgi:hypothetical protein
VVIPVTRALVVYESVFGDARAIADAILAGLSRHLPAGVVAAADAPAEVGADVALLVVGGPNHAFGMPRPLTRKSAVTQYGADIPDTQVGLHEWLESARLTGSGTLAAAFDTRGADHPLISKLDHAARTEEKLLTRLGATVVAPAEHFFVADVKGPLAEGEEDRARSWGETLAGLVVARSGAR